MIPVGDLELERYAGLLKREAESISDGRLKTLAFKIVLALRREDAGEAKRLYGTAKREFTETNKRRNSSEDVDC